MTVSGQWLGDVIKGRARRAAVEGLHEGAKTIGRASAEVAPQESSELRNSLYTDADANTLIAIVGYDVPRDIKTIKQHEDLTYHHPPGEQAKFLEQPVRQHRATIVAELATKLKGVLG